ncbi:hypothetical protein BDV29DRAFT_155038 [Aspergillus leporis]|uniref:Mid2 domain-containing protein n=1 Tax=Aspergillus leporis TaxID=41062 RepID=A0A5N5XA30_9EURO|nr:hypothetical protein BDV29DRAFT_155038 [Aspergillus leporis]
MTTSAPSTTTSAPSSSSQSGLGPTAKTAVGIGVGVGVPTVALLAALTFLKYRQSKKRVTSAVPPPFASIPPRGQAPPSPPKEVAGSHVSEWYPELPDRQY